METHAEKHPLIIEDGRSLWTARWHLLAIALVIGIVAESIGPFATSISGVKVTILPIIYAVIIGIVLTPPLLGRYLPLLRRWISAREISLSTPMIALTIYPLGIMFGIYAGPKAGIILQAGPALLLQEFGHLATCLIAMPIALLLGLGRSAWGSTYSLCRDTALGISADRYGLNSPEGMGTLGTYIVGSVIGTVYFALLAPIGIALGYHPFALAMASGMGSASMMGAATASLIEISPLEMKEQILAYSATSGLITGVFGIYMELFLAFPLANFYYRKLYPLFARFNAPGAAHETPRRS